MHALAAQRKIKWLGTGAKTEGAEKRDAEGGEWGGAIPLPSRLEGLGERRKLPQPKTICTAFSA